MFLRAEPTEQVAEKVLKEFSDIEGLKEIVNGILSLNNSEDYKELVYGTDNDPRINSGDYDEPSKLIKLASKNMSKFPLRVPMAPLITAKDVLVIYTILYDLYSINAGVKLTSRDIHNVFYGDMATRVLLMLDNFDSNLETPLQTDEFFKRLGKVKWQDKKAKKFFNKIDELYFILVFNKKWAVNGRTNGRSVTIFETTQKAFIRLLSGCSAVIGGRDKIDTFDVIRANQTYLKLINTDISKLM